MAIEFHCGTCNKLLRTTDDKAGRRARCPECGEPFVVPAPAVASAAAAFDFSELDVTLNSPPVPIITSSPFLEADDTPVVCPMCGEQVAGKQSNCPSCGEELRMTINLGGTFSTGNIIDVNRVLQHGWRSFLRQPGLCLSAGAVLLLIFGTIAVSFGLLTYYVGDPGAEQWSEFDEDEFGFGPWYGDYDWAGWMLLGFALPVILLLVGNWANLGGARFFLKLVRGQLPDMSELLSGRTLFGRGLFNSFILGICVIALNIAVGIILAIFGLDEGYVGWGLMLLVDLLVCVPFLCFYFVIVDRDAPGLTSLRQSQLASDGNFSSLLVITLLLVLLNILGTVAVVIGLIFTVPLSLLILAAAYEQMTTSARSEAFEY